MNQHNPKVGRYQPASTADSHVVTLRYVVYVDGDGRVGADTVFLHQRDHLKFENQSNNIKREAV